MTPRGFAECALEGRKGELHDGSGRTTRNVRMRKSYGKEALPPKGAVTGWGCALTAGSTAHSPLVGPIEQALELGSHLPTQDFRLL